MATRKTRRTARPRQVPKRGRIGRSRRAAASARKKRAAASARKKRAAASARKKRAAASARKKSAARKAVRVRKASARRAGARKASVRVRTAPARKAPKASKASARLRKTATASRKNAGLPKAMPQTAARSSFAARRAPSLDRERRIVRDDDVVPTPPSSLDFDRSASAARSGRRELHQRFAEHTDTGPAITGGDIDADWESAYTVGDEAPGGDNPTPDQDIVEDIGRAVGVQYEDNEELKGEAKIADRDRKRWELDPASSEDYNDR